MSSTELAAEIVDGVGVVSLNRPHRHNAVTDALFDALSTTVRRYLDDPAVGCLLLRGEGPSFCSGRDTAELGHRAGGEDDFTFVRAHQRLRLDMLDATKPIVAAVQGAALGGGFEMALAADIRIIADNAVFGLPEVELGLVPDTGGTQILPALVGPARAKYLVLSGTRIDAATAYAWGLAEELVPADVLRARAMQLCRLLATRPALAMSMGKMLVNQSTAGAIRTGIGQELLAQTALFGSSDYQRIKQRATGARQEGH
ncbi:enoyl-CoA hydratase/isomerase family protein [Mycobacterium sp. SMC-2]|uniref:enoyl-CoA hydratase/isomerase family protein n=1 Tax=Mycobacterium TaxID=1763 RepID=UPI001CE1AA8B|nr:MULTISPECIES: enoyl-CoA hydratase/isomerase family protein [Mycobacterium]MCA4759087.1 enoyl-CoA hydratase/isomerase family protein [Mycobacterium avium subsp. hominissuis]UXA06462.1 enoyl-CoA hydratase/isomerase family protein [Mycobacterium sp. SMC-2]